MAKRQTSAALLIITLAVLCSCGGGGGGDSSVNAEAGPNTARATAQSVLLDEDSLFAGTVSAVDPTGPVAFRITSPPAHGAIALVEDTGAFSYVPASDYFGTDSFVFAATDATGATATATVALRIDGVDDPPEIEPLPDARNSAQQYEVVLPLTIREMDADPVTVTATAQDSTVVEALIDPTARHLILRPKRPGTSRIEVRVNDGSTSVSTGLTFTVQDVARDVVVLTSAASTQAIVLTNTSSAAQDFELTHNGHHAFASMEQVLEAIRAQPDEIAGEPLERKIWRFVRDNTYHASPVNAQSWMNATWPVLNSFGWGFCSHVSAVYLKIAEALGYEARIWGLNGHVVPEIRVNGRWQMYDPDLSVYYHDREGNVAGVEQLAADSTLISAPISPIFSPGADRGAYGQYVADIYGSAADNRNDNPELSTEPFQGSRIALPPGGRLIYPGQWTAAPTGYDGTTPSTIEQFRQARLEVPADFTGAIGVPWVLWDVQGTGVVRINGRDFDAGSQDLQAFLVQPGAGVTAVEVIGSSTGLALIMLINPLWYDMQERNELMLTGKDVWALQAATYSLPLANRPPPPVPASLRKPQAIP